jgi:hypothetical protein
MRYEEHPLFKKLKDCSILEYKPKWTKNIPEKIQVHVQNKKSEINWDTF